MYINVHYICHKKTKTKNNEILDTTMKKSPQPKGEFSQNCVWVKKKNWVSSSRRFAIFLF